MTRSSTKELITPIKNPERVFRSKRRLFETPGLVESSTLELDLFSDIEEHSEEETTKIITETKEQIMSKPVETMGQEFGSEHEDANEHIEKVLEIVDLFHIPEVTQDQVMLRVFPMSLTGAASRWLRNEPSGSITNWETLKTKFLNKYCPPARTAKKMEEINNFQQEPDESLFRAWERFKELLMKCPQHYLTDMQEVILFYNGLDVPTRQILDSKGAIPTKTAADAKIAIQEMAEYSQKWHNGTSSKAKSTKTSDGLAAIQAQLNNLRREIKKVNEKVYAAQFEAPYQPARQYRAVVPGFYQRNNRNSMYPDRRQTLEESLTKFMAESTKRHEENSNIIKEIRASTNAAIRNQGASIKTLEIQIGQMSKVLQERGIKGLPDSTEPKPRDHVKSISTAKADSFEIRHMGCCPYAISGSQHKSIFSETVPFLRRLQNYCCDDWREVQDVKILEAYDRTLPQKEKEPGSFTLPCFIHNVCFDKALVDLGASVRVMPFYTYTNLGLGILSHTRFTIELADITIKQPRGIAENVLVRIGKFIFPIDIIILDIPEDDDVPLILGRPFLSTAIPRLMYKNVNADFIPSLSVNLITKSFYYSIIKDKDDNEGKSPASALIDIPIVVGNFAILIGFIIISNEDVIRDVALGMPFFIKYVSCQMIMKKFAHRDKCERMMGK
ncbi:hypothetical protein Tco_0111604 [Tanacetum coccineum]